MQSECVSETEKEARRQFWRFVRALTRRQCPKVGEEFAPGRYRLIVNADAERFYPPLPFSVHAGGHPAYVVREGDAQGETARLMQRDAAQEG